METNYLDKRKSGISLIGDVLWGTSLCQFYQTREDLLDILGPYFKAGLENNEFCVWVTSDEENVKRLLYQTVPDIEKYLLKGQFEIISDKRWTGRSRKSDKSILARLDKAISLGFDGVRLEFDFSPDINSGKISIYHDEIETISRYNIIAIFSYPRDRFDAVGLMEIVKNHQCALIRNSGKWEVLESSDARIVRNALVRGEEKLKAVFSHMAEGFAYHRIVLDEKGQPCDYIFLEVNEAFEKFLGLKAKDIIGKRVTRVLPGIEKDPADWIGRYGKVALTGKPARFESYAKVLKKWYSVSAFSPNRGFFGITFSDITERKNYENEILKTKTEWERTFNSVPDLIVLLDNKHRVIRANKAMADRLGLTPEKCAGLHCYQVVHGLSKPPEFCPHSLTCRDKQEHTAEVHEPRLGGDFLVSTTPVLNDLGEVTGSIHVSRDITELKKTETELQTSRRFLEIANQYTDLRSLLQAFVQQTREVTNCEAVGIRLLDDSGNIPYYACDDFNAQFPGLESPLSIKSDRCMCVNVIKGTTNPDMPFYTSDGSFYINGTSRFLTTDNQGDRGRTCHVCNTLGYESVALIPIRVGVHIIGLIHLADHKENMVPLNTVKLFERVSSALGISVQRALAEMELKKRTAELETSNKELESFSYTVSHDLRAPLRSMDGYSQAMLEDYADKLDEQGKKWLTNIRASSQEMAQLIDDILGLSRVVRSELHLQNVNLSDLAGSITRELQRTQPDRQVEFIITPGLESFGDANLLKIALTNLLGNAFKFTAGCRSARIEFGFDQQDGRRVYFVRDNGAGFEMKYINKMFKPFQRLHSDKNFPGTGIGLVTVQRIIQRHGGEVWAEGEINKGATFYFTINQGKDER